MKKILLILMFAIVALGSCKKEETPVPQSTIETYHNIRVTVEMSNNHTLMYSFYELRAIVNNNPVVLAAASIPTYATFWEKTKMCRDSTVVRLYLKVDNVSSPSHATTKVYNNGILDTTIVTEFNAQNYASGVNNFYVVEPIH